MEMNPPGGGTDGGETGDAKARPGEPSEPAVQEQQPSAAGQGEPAASSLPRGASGSELDHLRATVKVAGRPLHAQEPAGRPILNPAAKAPPLPPSVILAPELNRLIDEGRALLDTDVKAAHERFERAYLRNLNDVRVLSHYGLTLVLVEGDRQRGIRFCEEAARRGPLSTELLVNLARALVQTRNKEQAVRALRRAQELAPDDPRVGAEFVALGLRRRPPLPFLPRSFFLNRWLGHLTWKLWGQREGPLALR